MSRNVVVTGASSGIGRATALHLNRHGWRVFAGMRHGGDALVASASNPDRLVPLTWDVTSDDDTAAAVAAVTAALPSGESLDGYFSNAGIAAMTGDVSAEGTPMPVLQRLVDVNYLGAVRGIRAFLPMLRESRGVVVVNSALMTATVLPFNGGYAPSKSALEAWAVSLRKEVAPLGVAVVVVRAAAVRSAMEGKQDPESVPESAVYPQMRDFIRGAMVQMTRMGDNSAADPERVAEKVGEALDRTCRRRYRLAGVGAVPIRAVGLLPPALQDAVMRRVTGYVAGVGEAARPRALPPAASRR